MTKSVTTANETLWNTINDGLEKLNDIAQWNKVDLTNLVDSTALDRCIIKTHADISSENQSIQFNSIRWQQICDISS